LLQGPAPRRCGVRRDPAHVRGHRVADHRGRGRVPRLPVACDTRGRRSSDLHRGGRRPRKQLRGETVALPWWALLLREGRLMGTAATNDRYEDALALFNGGAVRAARDPALQGLADGPQDRTLPRLAGPAGRRARRPAAWRQ